MPFDHFTENRAFIGSEVGYPRSYERRVFGYMKGWDFSPTMWYSNRSENDFDVYAQSKAQDGGLTMEEAVRETGSHEAAHILVIDPIVKLAMRGNEHSWLTEAMAQFYGDTPITKARRIEDARLVLILEV